MSSENLAAIFAACLIVGLAGSIAAYAAASSRSLLVTHAPKIAALVAVTSTMGSLYFSEVADFVPCELCWFQRIAMYPMAVLLPLAVVRGDRTIMPYVATISAIGLATSAYHIQVQWFPERSNTCSFDDPCTAKWVEAFGVFTIPQMAAMGFLLILLLAIAVIRNPVEPADADVHADDESAPQSVAYGG